MTRGARLVVLAVLLTGCPTAPAPLDAGSALAPAPRPAPDPADPEVLRFDPGATFRLRLFDVPGHLRLSVVLREARTGAALEVVDYPPRGARPRSDPPMVLARTLPLTRAQVASLWSALEAAGLWTGAEEVPGPGAARLQLEARLGGRARQVTTSMAAPVAAVLAPVRAAAQVDELEKHGKPRVAAVSGPPTEAIAVVADPTRVVLVQDSPDGARLTLARDGELLRVTRRLPVVTFTRRHRRHVAWLQVDRWLPRDALEEALARAEAAGLWELPDPASSSRFATRLSLHTEGHDLVLATPPGPDPEETFRALAPLRALAP